MILRRIVGLLLLLIICAVPVLGNILHRWGGLDLTPEAIGVSAFLLIVWLGGLGFWSLSSTSEDK